jgi:ribose/xylose/arabinose/galactoside ABC-type transport system permease subunit
MIGVNADWFQVALGTLLIAAVLINNQVRRLVEQRR